MQTLADRQNVGPVGALQPMPNLLDESKPAVKDFENRRRKRFKLVFFSVLAASAVVLLLVLLSKLHRTSTGTPTEDSQTVSTNGISALKDL